MKAYLYKSAPDVNCGFIESEIKSWGAIDYNKKLKFAELL